MPNDRETAAFDAQPHVHPTVRLDFLVRITTYPFFVVLYLVHIWPRGVSRWVLVLFGFHLVFPLIARFIATRSRDSKAAELRNLLVDSVIIGSYVPLSGFSIWPNMAGLIGVHSGNLSVGGWRFALKGLVATGIGVLIVSALLGTVTVNLTGASLLTEVLGIGMILVYVTVFSMHSHTQSQRNVQNLRRIREQSAQIAEKSQLVEVSRDAAEAANAAKSTFLANMSHELRTPLNAIIGYGEMLIEEAEDSHAEALVPDLEKITTSGKQLLSLINDVLDLSKIEAGRMELYLETFLVSDLVASVTTTIRPLVQKGGNVFESEVEEGLGTIRADLTRLRQVLLNLLSNASKFTSGGRIALRAYRDSDDEVVFVVSDSGIGMTEDQLARLFQPFTQADASTTRKYGGTGLGLTITKHFIEMMGGSIAVESVAESGTSFTVRVPSEVTALLYTNEHPVPVMPHGA
ncbi:MAG: ATP-binding protein [Gemmatimonadaceae bacterium]